MTPCIGCRRPIPVGIGGRCPACRNPARRIRSGGAWTRLSRQVRAIGRCARCGTTAGPFEANHVQPLADDPYQLPTAECLCIPCHRVVTREQAVARREALGHLRSLAHR